jgi:hypothetical protein
MKNINISQLFIPLKQLVQRFHTTLFIVAITAGLAFAVIILNNLILAASDPNSAVATTTSTSFDQITIDKIKQLHTSDQGAGTVTLPTGRINPFAE